MHCVAYLLWADNDLYTHTHTLEALKVLSEPKPVRAHVQNVIFFLLCHSAKPNTSLERS